MNRDKNIEIRVDSTYSGITSKEFDDLLKTPNLKYLEEKSNECLAFLSDNSNLPIALEDVSKQFPAYTSLEKHPKTLLIKYPTYKLVFKLDYDFEIQKIFDILSQNEMIKDLDFDYYQSSTISLDQDNYQEKFSDFLISLKNTLEESYTLIRKIKALLEGLNIYCAISPASYKKSYKIELTEDKEHIARIIL